MCVVNYLPESRGVSLFAINNKCNPVIFGIEGLQVTGSERDFFRQVKPLGFILFARNIDTPDQVKALTADLKNIAGYECPILIDQEGGRVARLRPPHWPEFCAMGDLSKEQVFDNAYSLGKMLAELGINVNCAPVCDLRLEGAHDIIGDRSFGEDPEYVASCAKDVCDGLLKAGVEPVVKHIPGHGRALADSHLQLPVVDTDIKILEQTDFKAFKLLAETGYLAMTAHVLFTALDPHNPATLSKDAISYIKTIIGYQGPLITDDMSMKALSGDLAQLTTQALSAGCDVILHCNGEMKEMIRISEGLRQSCVAL